MVKCKDIFRLGHNTAADSLPSLPPVEPDLSVRKPAMPLKKEKVTELVLKYRGNLTKVAQALKCSRGAVRRICNINPEIKELLDECRERVVDEVEDTFLKKCMSGDTTSMIFFLKTRARERGYDQDLRADIEGITRSALQFALNQTRNPAE